MDAGRLPALARLRAEGSLQTLSSVFPSVTGPAYAPFLVGMHPGSVGLPGLRWYDRSRGAARWPPHARSYVGAEMLCVDGDMSGTAHTMFELAESSIGALSVIGRGLRRRDRIGRGAIFAARTAITHFRGDVRGWLDIDRHIGDEVVRRVHLHRPEYVFAAFTGIDKTSHASGAAAPEVLEAMRIVDDVAGRIRADAEHSGRWRTMQLWVVSDHGHSPVSRHDDLAAAIAAMGHRTLAHPWVFTLDPDVAVMVSGNAMAHVYVDLSLRTRAFWPLLAGGWGELASALLERESVDLLLLPLSASACEVRSRVRGRALLEWRDALYSYRPITGDPLGTGELDGLTADESYSATINGDYPDALVQIARLVECDRSGDIILSASRQWDFRARHEPIRHVSAHGALHREHMLVPLLTNRPLARTPRRTVDLMPSACDTLGIPAPSPQGRSFV